MASDSQEQIVWEHPIRYTIFKPNDLIKSNETELHGAELKLYNEVLNDNHSKNPDCLEYRIPYDLLFKEKTNLSRNKKNLCDAMQSRKIFLDKAFTKKWFNENGEMGIVLIPTITFEEDKNSFVVELNKHFKRILTLMDGQLAFTKGDINLLRGFKHDTTTTWYWLARQKQQFRNVWEVELEEFRDLMGIKGHKDYRNLKKRVLETLIKETVGTFMEFTLVELKGGRGGKVKKLKFIFKYGPKEIKDKPIGYEYEWEKPLQIMGVSDLMIKKFRHYVKSGYTSTTEDDNNIHWDDDYVRYSLKAAKIEFEAKLADSSRNQIKNKVAWFVNGLSHGQWLDYVEDQKQYNKVQQQINF